MKNIQDQLKNIFEALDIDYSNKITSTRLPDDLERVLPSVLARLREVSNESKLIKKSGMIRDFELQKLINSLILIGQLLLKDFRKYYKQLFYFIKIYWYIESIFIRHKMMSNPLYSANIANYNWIIDEEILKLLELIHSKGKVSIFDEKYKYLTSSKKEMLENLSLIVIDDDEISLTDLSKAILESYRVLDFYYYFSGDFIEDILSA
ncbi:MAG: hypothetical protein ACTSRW_07845 [Candidatus Helarchaeota archaeon]